MCAAQSNPPPFGYTWGFADNGNRAAESVLEISPNINYTVSGESVSEVLICMYTSNFLRCISICFILFSLFLSLYRMRVLLQVQAALLNNQSTQRTS